MKINKKASIGEFISQISTASILVIERVEHLAAELRFRDTDMSSVGSENADVSNRRSMAGMFVRAFCPFDDAAAGIEAGRDRTCGVAGALALGQVLRSLLFEMSAADPLTIAGGAVTLLAVAALACAIPARRAMRVDPMTALRYE